MAGKIKKLNFAGASLLGQERHLLMSRSFADFLPLEQRGHVQALMHQVTYSGDDQQCNVQLHTSIDQVKDVMVVMSPLARGQGYMLLLTDITAHQPLEDDLFQTQGYLQAIFESLPQYLAVLDEEAKVIQTNALWNTYALSTGHAYRNGFANAYYADLIDGVTGGVQQTNSAVMAGVVDVISGKAPSFQLEYTFQSGVERRYFVMHVIAVRDSRARAVVSHQELSRYKTEYVQRVTHTARHRAA
jgi:transcriptional regulator with PAS, ATPase and Fis domain